MAFHYLVKLPVFMGRGLLSLRQLVLPCLIMYLSRGCNNRCPSWLSLLILRTKSHVHEYVMTNSAANRRHHQNLMRLEGETKVTSGARLNAGHQTAPVLVPIWVGDVRGSRVDPSCGRGPSVCLDSTLM